MTQTLAYKEGYQASRDSISSRKNPYNEGESRYAYSCWLTGWLQQKKDEKLAMPFSKNKNTRSL